MGMLLIQLRPNFLGLFKFLNKMNWFIVFLSLINLSMCIYEDQMGKFDWRQTYVGRIKFTQFDTVSTAKKIIVATEENVLAALNLKTGEVVWRHVFETAAPGNIQLLHLSDKLVTVSGTNPYLVRGWDQDTGILLYEWSLNLQNSELAEYSEFWVQRGTLVHMLPVFGSHLEVTTYSLATGENRGSTSKLPAVWINEGCVLSEPFYSCISGAGDAQILISLDVTSNAVQVINKPLNNFINEISEESNLRKLDGNSIMPGFIIDDSSIVLIRIGTFEHVIVQVLDPTASVAIVESSSGPIVIQIWQHEIRGFTMHSNLVATGEVVSEVWCQDYNLVIPSPEISGVICTKSTQQPYVCRLAIVGNDDAFHLMQQGGRIQWTREEALANVVAAEFVELPVSELDAAIESEFDQKEGSIWSAFTRRLGTQWQQLVTLVQSLQGDGASPVERNPLVRDYFNLHKIIVLVTEAGKIFGMDNLSGAILWQRYEPALDSDSVVVFPRRTARHPPHGAVLTLLGKHEETGNGLIISLNPITGTLTEDRILHLDVPLLQAALLPRPDNDKLHALVLLDKEESVQVLPRSASSLVENMHMYVAERDSAGVQGYALRYNGQIVEAQRTWSLNLSGNNKHRILVALHKPWEKSHSAGKVLGDRSVLYKYINPNLLLIVTGGPDPTHKETVTSWLVDGVSGAVTHAHTHRRARATPFAVHTDNLVAYLYWNDKQRRTEISTMELYEGPTRWLEAGAAFSSLAGTRVPRVVAQTFILPATASAAALTTTQRAITDTHVLVGLHTGAILELPWSYLDPRRPLSPTPEQREEGLIPYAPELPMPAEAVLNYNLTLHRINKIYTNPAGLESTSLVLATGLDIFYTRVAPSKTFDLLKDDFDYYLITIVLGALIVATYSTKYFASRKMLKMAWK